MQSNNYSIRFLMLIGCLMVIDVIIKAFIIRHFQPTEMIGLIEGKIMIGRIQNLSMAFGFRNGFPWMDRVRIIGHLLVLWLTFRIQQRPVSKGYKYGSLMIAGSVIAGYVDRLLFSGGVEGYRSTDYIFIYPIEGVFSISTVLGNAGILVLIISIFISFKDVKVIFSRTAH